ncbi:MAG TPA: calcium/sodium antiporter [Rhodospirillales bacterium]|jgi:cation:H+ antiporter|nr:calcium/sodium antiporter [Rhodospirillales bacterium]
MMYVYLAAGFMLLLGGAEVLVRGAVALAQRLDISPLIIGMTVVALGTSAPELMVSLDAALSGSPGIALGNVVGSNIANLFLILGTVGIVMPIAAKSDGLWRDGLILLAGSLLFVALCWSGMIGFWPGILLLAVFVAFLGHSYWRETKNDGGAEMRAQKVLEIHGVPSSVTVAWLFLTAGLASVIFGAHLLVMGGVAIAKAAGVSEEVIGLTMIAFGTSLPELATSVVAAWRGHAEIALGNVVGSNLFNMLLIVGVVAVVTPLQVPAKIMVFDLWVMLAATAVFLPFLACGWRFDRFVAVVFLAAYVAYIAVQAYDVQVILPAAG